MIRLILILWQVRLIKRLTLPSKVRKEIRIGTCMVRAPPTGAKKRKKHLLKLFSINLNQALNREVLSKYSLLFQESSYEF